MSAVLDYRKDHNIPLTRENYLLIAYQGDVPEEIGPQLEMEMPNEFRLPTFRDEE